MQKCKTCPSCRRKRMPSQYSSKNSFKLATFISSKLRPIVGHSPLYGLIPSYLILSQLVPILDVWLRILPEHYSDATCLRLPNNSVTFRIFYKVCQKHNLNLFCISTSFRLFQMTNEIVIQLPDIWKQLEVASVSISTNHSFPKIQPSMRNQCSTTLLS